MEDVKLTKMGNLQGFAISKELLDKSEFKIGDTLEIHFSNGRLILFKKPPHHSEMNFEGKQDIEDLVLASANLGEWE